jgi:hypothetical protein
VIRGRVIRILDDRRVVLNVGLDDGVERGMRFGIYTPQDEIVDPESGENLGSYRERKATAIAQVVAQRFTILQPPPRGGNWLLESFKSGRPGIPAQPERDDPRFPVEPYSVQPLPTGSTIKIGDAAEEIPTQKQPSTEEAEGQEEANSD